MEISATQNTNPLKSNLSRYVYGDHSEKPSIIKSTPRKCKLNHNYSHHEQPETKMKKSSSLHNIKNINDIVDQENKDQTFNSIHNFTVRQNVANVDKQVNVNSELLRRIDKEKRQYEAQISELIQINETRKKDREMVLLENRKFIEKLKNIQTEFDLLFEQNDVLQTKLLEFGIKFEFKRPERIEDKKEFLNASGDNQNDCISIAVATIGDSMSAVDDFSDDSQMGDGNYSYGAQQKFANELLDALSVETLQDRIMKMEEDNYSTTEELQATMQELIDLQKTLDKVNEENRTICSDRQLLLETINKQTRSLESSSKTVDILKKLLLTDNTGKLAQSPQASPAYSEEDFKELYCISMEENETLVAQNEVFKQTLFSYHFECKGLTETVEQLGSELDKLKTKCYTIEDQLKTEIRQREQVEALLRHNNEYSRSSYSWTDCSGEVLSLIQLNTSLRQQDVGLKTELEQGVTRVQSLEQELALMHRDCCRKDTQEQMSRDVAQLQLALTAREDDLRFVTGTLESMRHRYGEEISEWRQYERDLLTSIVAADSLREERDCELLVVRSELETVEQTRRQLQERLDHYEQQQTPQQYCIHCVGDKVASGGSGVASRAAGLMISSAKSSDNIAPHHNVKMMIQSIEEQAKLCPAVSKPESPPPPCAVHTIPRTSVNSILSSCSSSNGSSAKSTNTSSLTRTSTVGFSRISQQQQPATRYRLMRQDKDLSDKSTPTSSSSHSSATPVLRQSTMPASVTGPSCTKASTPSNSSSTTPTAAIAPVSRLSPPSSVTSTPVIPPALGADSKPESNPSNECRRHQQPPPSSSVRQQAPTTVETQTVDPLAQLVKITNKGSKRNALLFWCQKKVENYAKIDITNFSSSWNDGLALCALLHSCDSSLLDYKRLAESMPANPDKKHKRTNFQAALDAAERAGIRCGLLDIETMATQERPDWNLVMNYVVQVYKRFELPVKV